MKRTIALMVAKLIGLSALTLALVLPASSAWKEQVLYSFQGGTGDGFWPIGGVVFDKAGNLYGATEGGGPASCYPDGSLCGAVYELSPPAKKGAPWAETVLVQFKGKQSNDVSLPSGGLIMDSAGNLYGVSAYGGTGSCVLLGTSAGCGTVYELSPPQQKGGPWTETILYSFQGGNDDGYYAWGSLTFDKAGNLYGATQFGGGKGNTCNIFYGGNCGIVFKLAPPTKKGGEWTEQVLHAFAGGKDGAGPNGGLLLDKHGVIYGTSSSGGNQGCSQKYVSVGCGTAFELKPPMKMGGDWPEQILHRFTGGDDGSTPNGSLIFDGKRVLYGTAGGGGTGEVGVVFVLKTRAGSWTEEVIHNFVGDANGRNPNGGLTTNPAGDLFGTALDGADYRGVLFSLTSKGAGSWVYSNIYDFAGPPDGSYPQGSLVFDQSGNLYSTTTGGGSGQACQGGCGTIFEASPHRF